MARAQKTDKFDVSDLPCQCGCGGATKQPSAAFLPGHDAKLKSIVLKIERGELKASALPRGSMEFLAKRGVAGRRVIRKGKSVSVVKA